MSKYYFHGVKQLLNFYAVEQILISGGIKSKNLQHRSYKIGFNGNDYVSVCKKLIMVPIAKMIIYLLICM